MDIGLITNGDVPLPDDKLIQVIKNTNWIRISMDGATPDQYMHSHGMDSKSFDRMLQNTANIIRVRNANALRQCDIGTGYLTDEVTKGGIVQATKMCKEMGWDIFNFVHFFTIKQILIQSSKKQRSLRMMDSELQEVNIDMMRKLFSLVIEGMGNV